MIRRIALMRAEDDSEATAAELAARGYEAVIAPAIEIRALPAALPEGRFDALVADQPARVSGAGRGRSRQAGDDSAPCRWRARCARGRETRASRSPANPPPTPRRWRSGWRERCRRARASLSRRPRPQADARGGARRRRPRRPGGRTLRCRKRARRGARAKPRRSPAATARCTIRAAPPRSPLRSRRGRGSPNPSARFSTSASRPTSPSRSPPTARRESSAPTLPTRRVSWRRSSARSALRPKAEAGATVRDAAPVSNPGRLAYKVARSDSEGPWPRIRSRAPNRRSARRRRPPRRVLPGPTQR